MVSRTRPDIVTAVVAGLLSLIVMSGTAWAKTTSCGGGQVIEGTTISGNLSVGPGGCTLRNTSVTAAVNVQPGAELFVEGQEATLGSLTATQAAVVDVFANQVTGAVRILETGSVNLFGFQAGGNITVRKSTGDVTLSNVGAGVPDQSGKITVSENVGGSLRVAETGTAYITITNNVGTELIEEGNNVIPGNVAIIGNKEGGFKIGSGDQIAGSLAILRNEASGAIEIDTGENPGTVLGTLRCFGNSPAPIGGDMRTEPEQRKGQCKNL